MEDRYIFWSPSISRAFWTVSKRLSARGKPFTISEVALHPSKSEIVPELKEVTFTGYFLEGETDERFSITREVTTMTTPHIDRWAESSQVAFLALTTAFAEAKIPFTLGRRTMSSLDRGPFTQSPDGLVTRIVSIVLGFEGRCQIRERHSTSFLAEIRVQVIESLSPNSGHRQHGRWEVVKEGPIVEIK